MIAKIALIGDEAVAHYTIANRLWELLSVVANIKFNFEVVPLASPEAVREFFETFKGDSHFKGFNIAVPWKEVLGPAIDQVEQLNASSSINTVYRRSDGAIAGVNTDPSAAQRAVESCANLYKCRTALVIGARGSGEPYEAHLRNNLGLDVVLYDIENTGSSAQDRSVPFSRAIERRYDLIINAMALGRAYYDKPFTIFHSPLDMDLLSAVSHPHTIVQETNYLPSSTLLVQMAKHLNLQTVTGDWMVVFRAVESLKRYFGMTLDENSIRMLVEEIGQYIAERQTEIISRN